MRLLCDVQVVSWGRCPALLEQLVSHTALPWDAEIAELTVQLESFTWHGSVLLPNALVQQVMGFTPSAVEHRCAAAVPLGVACCAYTTMCRQSSHLCHANMVNGA
jgi:hypothetical protein